jgi:uncharacterized integral membrane protein
MGETQYFQQLTKEDRITVGLYRTGIILSTVILCASALLAFAGLFEKLPDYPLITSGAGISILLLLLYFSVGLSVFFIHLYVGRFHRVLKKIYFLAVFCLALLFVIGNGNPAVPLFKTTPYSALLLLPLSLCLGFVTAKEAFCFRLFEGYILAIIMPAYVFFYGIGITTRRGISTGLALVAVLLVIFTLRKVSQPIHFDIGDKSAYQP